MSHRYAVLGAGRQGIAAAYDLVRFGEPEQVLLIDSNAATAHAAAERINQLLSGSPVVPVVADVGVAECLAAALDGVRSCVSAVPYRFNLGITQVAIDVGANMVDLGGHTGIVWEQLSLNDPAREAGVSIVPDCGMGPGMNVSLATYAMSLLDQPREVYIWDGGLPQDPKPPWNYLLTFSVGGLTNEYYGNACLLREGRLTEVPCFEGYEELDFPPPLGRLEAFVTSGGLSTAPWTFQGQLETLENKTLRYPGYRAEFSAFARLGLLGLEPVCVGGTDIVPRDLFHALLEPKVTHSEIRDVCLIKAKCIGERDGRPAEATVELIDYYDDATGFKAMQRLTGWHASIVAILAAQGRIRRGAIPIEKAVPGSVVVAEALRRGLVITERVAAPI